MAALGQDLAGKVLSSHSSSWLHGGLHSNAAPTKASQSGKRPRGCFLLHVLSFCLNSLTLLTLSTETGQAQPLKKK